MGLACPSFERMERYLRPLICPEESLAILHGEIGGNWLVVTAVIADILRQANPAEGLAVLWTRREVGHHEEYHLLWAFDGNVFALWVEARNMQLDDPRALMDWRHHGRRDTYADIPFPGSGRFDPPAFYAVDRDQLASDLLAGVDRGSYNLLLHSAVGMFYYYLPRACDVLKRMRREQEEGCVASMDAAEQDRLQAA